MIHHSYVSTLEKPFGNGAALVSKKSAGGTSKLTSNGLVGDGIDGQLSTDVITRPIGCGSLIEGT